MTTLVLCGVGRVEAEALVRSLLVLSRQQLIVAYSSEDGALVVWGIKLPTFADGLATSKQGSERSIKKIPMFWLA